MKLFFHRARFDIDVVGIENPTLCSFGIGEAIAATIAAVSAASAAASGAVAAGLTEIGIGASTAGIIGTGVVGALEGGALGALTNLKNPLKGAEFGAATGGLLAGGGALISNLTTPAIGGAASAASSAAPASIPTAGADVTSGWNAATSATGQSLTGGAQTALGGAGAPTGAAAGSTGNFMGGTSPTGQAISNTASGGAGSGGFMSGTSPGGQSLASSSTPGSVGAGAATGAPSLAQSVLNAPSSNLASGVGAIGSGTENISTSLADGSASIGAASNPTSFESFLNDPSFGTGWDAIKANPGIALNTVAFGADLIKGNQMPPGYDQMKSAAQFDTMQGNQLQGYLRSGTLPPGLQAGETAAAQAAKAAVRQQYASAGLSGSSSEMQDLQNVNTQIAAQSAQIAQQLFSQGVKESEMGQQLYMELMQINMQQDQQLASGISNFVTAMAGMTQPIHTGG